MSDIFLVNKTNRSRTPRTQLPSPWDPLLVDALCPPPSPQQPSAGCFHQRQGIRWSSSIQKHLFQCLCCAGKGDDLLPAGTEDYVHVRIQQRNTKKILTTDQGTADDYNKKKLVKALKEICLQWYCNWASTNGNQLQGDQSKNICQASMASWRHMGFKSRNTLKLKWWFSCNE